MIPIALGLIVKAATVVRAVQAISSALRSPAKVPVSESAPQSENVLCGRFAPTRDKYRYCGNSPVNWSDPSGLDPWYKDPNFNESKKIDCYTYKIERALELLRSFILDNHLSASLGEYWLAARKSQFSWDDEIIKANPDAAAHTIVPPTGGQSKIVFNSLFLEDDSSAFIALTLLHEGVHAAKGFFSSNFFPGYKEWEPSYIANDSLKAALGRYEDKWKLTHKMDKCKCP